MNDQSNNFIYSLWFFGQNELKYNHSSKDSKNPQTNLDTKRVKIIYVLAKQKVKSQKRRYNRIYLSYMHGQHLFWEN